MRVVAGWVRSAVVCAGVGLMLAAMPASASHFHRGPTSSHKAKHAVSGRHHRAERASAASHPRAIDDTRATQIQTALVKAGYLQTASGKWDTESADAMRKLQNDNGWQTKIIPDSRALIKLGLGPGSESPNATSIEGGPLASTAGHTDTSVNRP